MFSRGKNPCTVTGPGLPGKGIMNESRKMINWMAGVTTFVVALLIVIVLLDTEQDGVSLATALQNGRSDAGVGGAGSWKMRRRYRTLTKNFLISGM